MEIAAIGFQSVGVFAASAVPPPPPESTTWTLSPGSTGADYVMRSMPLQPADPSVGAVLGSQIGTYNTTMTRILSWDTDTQTYQEYTDFTGPIMPGDTAWFLFRNGIDLNFSGTQTQSNSVVMEAPCYSVEIGQNWNQVGNPFNYAINVSDIMVKEGSTEVYLTGTDNTVTQQVFWIYQSGEYVPATTLPPGTGGWVKKLSAGEGFLAFPDSLFERSRIDRSEVDIKDLEKPPAPPGFFSEASSSGGGGGCFISTTFYQ